MPALASIAAAWADLDGDELRRLFPNLRAHSIGRGEPFCFRCGWLAPTRDTASYPASWTNARKLDMAWNGAGGWLERAHLHDYVHGGSMESLNLVLLCPLCHERQPACTDRAGGVEFVNTPSPFAPLLYLAQMVTDEEGDRRHPGKAEAQRCMLRAFAIAGVAVGGEVPA